MSDDYERDFSNAPSELMDFDKLLAVEGARLLCDDRKPPINKQSILAQLQIHNWCDVVDKMVFW